MKMSENGLVENELWIIMIRESSLRLQIRFAILNYYVQNRK